ncbi:MAG: methionine biosynthesis protein MetW [Alphaproteobacteria bacterium]|nr:methionine biosynthesis protein MetW [Alphaproteobacteria bacterium]
MAHTQTLRPDLQAIAGMVAPGSSLLDVGCGEGELLAWLKENKSTQGRGIELSQQGVHRAIAKGLSVIQGNADTDLAFYPDQAYDYAILSQTLQTLRDPREVLTHLVRIARHAIVSVPNFGHWKNRLYLAYKGRMPVTKSLSYAWYDTPNIHFCTISDFVDLCGLLELSIEQRIYVNQFGVPGTFNNRGIFANVFGEQGIFMIRK